MPRLALQEVGFAYGDDPILAGVSLGFEAGTATAIVGPNGSGKTTLLRLAGGLLLPSSGTVTLEGHDLAGIPRRAAARRLAGIPAEEDSVFPFTVRETVELGRHPWRGAFAPLTDEESALVDVALERTALTQLADRQVPALSSGERQRVSIARCLVQQADVCLLDEPTAHLDLGQRLRMLRVLRQEAHAHGRTVLAVLHDLNLAGGFADRIVMLVDGRVLADGAPEDVLTPSLIEQAFGTPVRVMPHPDHGAPVVVPLEMPLEETLS